jgi:hypothetical protein
VLARITTLTGSMSTATRAALAAGVVMVVGGAAVIAVLLNSGGGSPTPRLDNLAQNTNPAQNIGAGTLVAGAESTPADGARGAASTSRNLPGDAPRATVANGQSLEGQPFDGQPGDGQSVDGLAAATLAQAEASSSPQTTPELPGAAEGTMIAAASEAPAFDAQRLAAAREGRLALVARTDRAARGAAALTALAARRDESWRLRDVPAERVVAAVTSRTSPDAPGVALVETPTLPIAVGSAFGLTSLDLPVVRASAVVVGPPVALAARAAPAAARVAEVSPTAEALEDLRSAVSARLRTEAEWVELPAEDGLAPDATQADPLWWTRPPREWAPRVRVPVVVTEGR